MFRTILAVSAAALAVAGPAMAQDRLPAEFPPESYTANQYVDSEGCAFIRAGIGGMTNWIPRMSRDREPLCGFQPSGVAAIAEAPAPAPAAGPAEARPAVAEPAPSRRAEAAPATPRPVSPRIVTPAPTPAAARPAPPVLTRAAFCEGRDGPQPGYVSSRTGETIICGDTREAAAPRPGAALRGAVTLAAVCADMAATGRRYVLQDSGEPVSCGPQDATAPRPGTRLAATRLPALPAAPAAPAPAGRAPAARTASASLTACDLGPESGFALVGPASRPRRCGPQAQSPSGLGNAARLAPQPNGVAAAMRFLDPQAGLRRAAGAVPLPDPAAPPPGYRSAWDDGRLNRHRGVRIVERPGAGQLRAPVIAAPVTVPEALVGRVSTRSAPVEAPETAQGRFVQLGAFAVEANADRAAARLRALGLPVAKGRLTRGGAELQVIATGPFEDAVTLGRALGAVRAAGYADAYARR
ncbi:SPOR domain-containing protein [Limimaricola sp.]|uniref:SPOR domain-containing protein n=1 Tax=Limimaricola sp. TaxID=2211665 RepID=UPI004059B3D7